ncbi:hypothetical protein GF318_01500 [Candidatus Micrarchaeota archaeon]|nr:hypothetical protein [Candidatus Micrarchaeota archaeon]
MKSRALMLALITLLPMAQATLFTGDGTYKMYIGDTAISSNDFGIALVNVTWHEGEEGEIVLDQAEYEVEFGGTLLSSPALETGESFTESADQGKENVTITVENLEYEPSPPSFTTYTPPRFPATTQIKSESYVPPPPDVEIEDITVEPTKFSAWVEWETDKDANGTLAVYNKTSPAPAKEYELPSEDSFHSVNVTGLKSDTSYSAEVTACTGQSCTGESENFQTLPVVPEICNVTVLNYTNDTAVIAWNTDVPSDSRVFYREMGTSEWRVVPLALPWQEIKQHFIFNLSKDPDYAGRSASFSGEGPALVLGPDLPDMFSLPEDYSIQSDYISNIDRDYLSLVIKPYHQIKLYGLRPETHYQFKASSCADRCANSSMEIFTTTYTIKKPHAVFVQPPDSVEHGTSAVLVISAYSQNPDGYLTGVELMWNDGGFRNLTPQFGGDYDTFVPVDYPTLSMASITFRYAGGHTVQLTVTDNYSQTTVETINIQSLANDRCSGTPAVYYPEDTECTDRWPNAGGPTVNYNNGIGACHAFEVCDGNLDYMIADAESCCNGEKNFSEEPTQNRGYSYNKYLACASAIANTKSKAGMFSMTTDSSMKICKASYLVYGIGSQAIYMKDYYTAEACCKASSFCEDYPKYQSWNPWPQSNIKFNELWCYWKDYGAFGKKPKNGWYNSDTNPESNNNALADIPAHASVNTMNTGTCVDYSFVVTTALRKAGFGSNEILSVRSPGHLYNLVWLPGDGKYSFIDTVGNNGGDFFTGSGWTWDTKKKKNLDHCDYDSNKCSNDRGMMYCPPKSMVMGCDT